MDLWRHSKELLDVTMSWVCSTRNMAVINIRVWSVGDEWQLSCPALRNSVLTKTLSWSLEDARSLTEILANLCVSVFTWEWANLTKVLTARQGKKKWISRDFLKKRASWKVDSRQSAQVISLFLWTRKSHSHLILSRTYEFSPHIHVDSSVGIVTTIQAARRPIVVRLQAVTRDSSALWNVQKKTWYHY
jgi:hypothetical protein